MLRRITRWRCTCARCLPEARGGASQYSALLAAQAESESNNFAEFERWITENLRADLSIESLADRAHMSPRNFARMYSKNHAVGRPQRPSKRFELMQRGDGSKRPMRASRRSPTSAATAVKSRCGQHS